MTDLLSDVLRAVRLTGAYFYLVEASSPWSVSTCAARELVPRVLPDAEHLISYHILIRGRCWGGIEGQPQVLLEPGDAILFPHGHATSRTVLAERFSELVGVSPMLYLTRWRLQLASEQLSSGSAKVAAIGAQVGYDSEAAFSRAFKRETGLSPAAWRRARSA